MPQVAGGPEELNDLLEEVYQSALKQYKGDKTKASATAWAAVKNAGWHKDKGGKWKKTEKAGDDMDSETFEEKVGQYNITQNEDGSYNILGVPIFATIEKDKKKYDETWLDAAAANFKAQKKATGYLPGIVLGHNKEGQEKESVGLLDNLTKKAKKLFADLTHIPAELLEKLKKGAWPGRSVETWHAQKRITALALLGGSTPAHKFQPLHVFQDAPDGELAWVEFAEAEEREFDVSVTLLQRVTKREIERKTSDVQWEAQDMIREVLRDEKLAVEKKKEYIDSILDDLAAILAQMAMNEGGQIARNKPKEKEGKKEMAEDKNIDLFTKDQTTAMEAIVTERVKEAMANAATEKEQFTVKVKDLETEIAKEKAEAKKAQDALTAKDKAEVKASIERFIEELRGKGVNAGFLDESGMTTYMESLAEDTKVQKFSEKQEKEVTKLVQLQTMISTMAKLAEEKKLIVPTGEQAPAGEQAHSFSQSDNSGKKDEVMVDADSVEMDKKIVALAKERNIDLTKDSDGMLYAQLFQEIGLAEEHQEK